jgi:hypothetical protein
MGIKEATARSLLRNGLDRLRKMMRADVRLRATGIWRGRDKGCAAPKATALAGDD